MHSFSWCSITITIKHAGVGPLFAKQESTFLSMLKHRHTKNPKQTKPTHSYCRECARSYILDSILTILSLEQFFGQKPPSGKWTH